MTVGASTARTKKVFGFGFKSRKVVAKNYDIRLAGILEMARIMISDVGIDNLNMRDLAAAIGTSLQTLNTSFGNKDQLLGRVVVDMFESIDSGSKSRTKNPFMVG